MLDRLTIRMRLVIVVVISMFGEILLFTDGTLTLHEEMIVDREHEIMTLVQTAVDNIDGLRAQAAAEGLSDAQIQQLAIEGLRNINHGEDEYFFVLDTSMTMIMHGVDFDLEGRDVRHLRDTGGVQVFADLVDAAVGGGGFVHYEWRRPGADQPVPKVSYAAAYEPWGWVIVTGVYIGEINSLFWAKATRNVLITVAVALITCTVAFFVSRSITNGVAGITGTMRRLMNGDTDLKVPYSELRTEIGEMAKGVEVFRVNTMEKAALERTHAAAEERAVAEKRATMERLANEFEASVGEVVTSVAGAAAQMRMTAEAMSSTATDANNQSTTVASAAEQAAVNVQTVASAADELGCSISEISRQISIQAIAADDAVASVTVSDTEIKDLAEKVEAIGNVVSLITGIAEQTNLLALNATIEAARAGEMGKGFAVVASEVKNLASQTARATDEIAGQIKDVQDRTGTVVTSIGDINTRIEKIKEISAAVAAAVEEQDAAALEIGRNTQEASTGTQQVSTAIVGVSEAVSQTGQSAATVLTAAGDLSHQSTVLSERMEAFMERVRTA